MVPGRASFSPSRSVLTKSRIATRRTRATLMAPLPRRKPAPQQRVRNQAAAMDYSAKQQHRRNPLLASATSTSLPPRKWRPKKPRMQNLRRIYRLAQPRAGRQPIRSANISLRAMCPYRIGIKSRRCPCCAGASPSVWLPPSRAPLC